MWQMRTVKVPFYAVFCLLRLIFNIVIDIQYFMIVYLSNASEVTDMGVTLNL
jgi:hypothetical protein